MSENQEALVELTIESDDFLTANERKKLYEHHPNIISIIPIIASELADNEQNNAVDLSKNMRELFKDYFSYKNDGQNPSDDIMQLFDEINSN